MKDFSGRQKKKQEEITPPVAGSSPGEPSNELDSEILIRRAFEQNYDEAVELLFRWYYAPLCNHAIRYVSSREVAEDLVSEVFCTFYQERLFDKIDKSFRTYLFTSIRNKAFNYVRMEINRSASIEHAAMVPDPACQQPDEIVHYEDLYHDVDRVINLLPQRRRKIYIMHRLEGKKHEEIAGELGISVNTVKEHMYQALQQIRGYLREKWLPVTILFVVKLGGVWNLL